MHWRNFADERPPDNTEILLYLGNVNRDALNKTMVDLLGSMFIVCHVANGRAMFTAYTSLSLRDVAAFGCTFWIPTKEIIKPDAM